jgi:mRNA interferase MazF
LHARDRLHQDCQVMVDQPRTLDRNRLGEGPLTRLTAQEQAQVNQALRVSAGPVLSG